MHHAASPRPRGWLTTAVLSCLLLGALAGCHDSSASLAARGAADAAPQAAMTPGSAQTPPALVIAARKQIGVTVRYDPTYTRIPYPGGDVPASRGVCTDVVIRALRTQGIDLQQRVHDDMRAHFSKYPQKWGLRVPDRNIDHRRVPNLQTWFAREGWSIAVTNRTEDYRAGDLVTWMLPGNLPHIGIVSDRNTLLRGVPLIIHNIGSGAQENDILFDYTITGHYRPAFQART
jgi:uncharacterized protein